MPSANRLPGILALLASLACSAAAAERAASLEARVQEAARMWKADDCAGVLRLLGPALADRGFARLDPEVRVESHWQAAQCTARAEDYETALGHARAGTALDIAGDNFWHLRFWLETKTGHLDQAVATVEHLARTWPEALNSMPIDRLGLALYELKRPERADAALLMRLLKILAAPAYQPDEITASSDFFRRDYASRLAAAGDQAAAGALLAQITDPDALMAISVDPRLRGFLPADFDGRAAVERELARAREVAASHSRSLAAVNQVAHWQRMLGHPQEALATLQAARPDANGADYEDRARYENWWWDELARSYAALGRYDDMTNAYRAGVAAKEGGGLNVSQTINLAHGQLRFGRYQEAIDTVAPLADGRGTSPYGKLAMRTARGCARYALRLPEAKEDLDYARAHEADSPGALTELAICSGDMDMAAASLIRRLDDPDRRSAALLELSDYDAAPPSYPATAVEKGLAALKTRADVQAAIARAGGTRRFRLSALES